MHRSARAATPPVSPRPAGGGGSSSGGLGGLQSFVLSCRRRCSGSCCASVGQTPGLRCRCPQVSELRIRAATGALLLVLLLSVSGLLIRRGPSSGQACARCQRRLHAVARCCIPARCLRLSLLLLEVLAFAGLPFCVWGCASTATSKMLKGVNIAEEAPSTANPCGLAHGHAKYK